MGYTIEMLEKFKKDKTSPEAEALINELLENTIKEASVYEQMLDENNEQIKDNLKQVNEIFKSDMKRTISVQELKNLLIKIEKNYFPNIMLRPYTKECYLYYIQMFVDLTENEGFKGWYHEFRKENCRPKEDKNDK